MGPEVSLVLQKMSFDLMPLVQAVRLCCFYS